MAPPQHGAAGDSCDVTQAGIEDSGSPWAGDGGRQGRLQSSKVYRRHILHLLCLNIFCLEAVCNADISIKKVQLGISKLAVFILNYPLKNNTYFKICWML